MSGGSPFSPSGMPLPMPPPPTTTAPPWRPTPPPPIVTLPGNVNLRDRVIELISGGSAGEKIVRGFLIGVALGLILGGLFCCWMPCFGRSERERRRRERAERMALLRGEAPLPTLPPRGRRGLRAAMPWLPRHRGPASPP